MGQFFVLGHPVGHSLSPAMHNAAYRALGLPWEYGLADCPTIDDAKALIANGSWTGLNVTMPYKPLACTSATWRSESARLVGGANVLARCGEQVHADNVDGIGCVSYLERCGSVFVGARVVVCGTGPTSLAILHASALAGASHVTLLGRDESKAGAVLAGFRERCAQGPFACEALLRAGSYATHAQAVIDADIVIDATPLGMRPGDPAPFDPALLHAGQTVLDVVYGHGETALVGAARAAGCSVHDGAGMLVAQAVETVRDFVSWLDVPVECDSVDLFGLMAQAAGFSGI